MLEEHFESRRDFLSGRIHRLYDKKDTILVYDYVDVHIPMFDQEIVWYGNINLLGKDTFNKLGYKAKINTHTTSYIN